MILPDRYAGPLCTLLLLLPVQSALSTESIDVRELGQPDGSSHAMPGFYVVNPDGESSAVDPVEAGLATTSSADFSATPPPEQAPAFTSEKADPSKDRQTAKKSDEPRRVLVRIKRKPPARSLSKQFQCERHGFYYTNDGRCILPAWGNLGIMPHLLPAPGPAPRGAMD